MITVLISHYSPGQRLAAASIAQWLEHWSCKPGVGSSILPGGYVLSIYPMKQRRAGEKDLVSIKDILQTLRSALYKLRAGRQTKLRDS